MADGKVSILVDLQDKKAIKNAKNLGKQISNTFKSIPSTFSNFGNRFTATFEGISKNLRDTGISIGVLGNNLSHFGSSLTRNITKPALVAGAAVTGITLTKGLQRLIGIDTARAKLVGLGHDANTVQAIMDSALQSVKGTSFGMDEAATTAANAVAAGVKEGEALTKYLTITGDAAAIAGSSMADMGAILNSVRTSNKAYNGDLQQLSNRGLPVFQWLADAAGVTAEEIVKMAADGKISSEMLMDAIDKNIGGAAKKMGEESFTAGLANMWAAVGRLGASFLDAGGKGGGFFSQLKPLIADMTNNLDTLGDWAAEMGVKFGEAFTNMIAKVKEIIQWYSNLSPLMQGIIKKVALFASIGLVSFGPLLTIIGNIVTTFATMFTVMSKVTGAISKIPSLISGIGKAIGLLTSPVGLVVVAIIAAAALIYIYWEPISEFFIKLWDSIKVAWDATATWLSSAWSKTVEFFKGLWNGTIAFLKEWGLVILGLLTGPVGLAAALIYKYWEPIKEFFVNVWETVKTKTSEVWNSIAEMASTAWTAITTMIMSILQPFIDLLMNLWNGVKDGIMKVFEGVKLYFIAVWDLIKNIFLGAILLIVNLVTGNFEELKNNTKAIWDNIKQSFSQIWEAIKLIFTGALNIIKGYVKAAWENIKTVTSTTFNGIRSLITTIWNGIKAVFNIVINFIVNFVKTSWNSIKSTTSSVFNGVKSLITSIWNGIKSFFTQTLSNIINTVRQQFSNMVSAIQSKMSEVKGKITSGWNSALSFLKGINLMSIGKDIIQGLINGITSKVKAVANAVKKVTDSITGKIKSILNIHSPSRWMRDMIGKNMMLGWQIGIEREKRSSEKMAEQATDWMTPEVPKVSGFVNKFKGISAPLGNIGNKSVDGIASAITNNNYSRDYDDSKVVKLLEKLVDKNGNVYLSKEKLGAIMDEEQAKRIKLIEGWVAID